MEARNSVTAEFIAVSENEALARTIVSVFVLEADPDMELLSDIRTAVSEAVTNSIIHGYNSCAVSDDGNDNIIKMTCIRENNDLDIYIEDYGCGISDIEKAMRPMFTTAPELERSGLGFTIMESFMDYLDVQSKPDEGTVVHMRKSLCIEPKEQE
ncbi:MAG: anti-sigma F factor [Clostridia bacterium]|nr:anti-sigma F factor [Clostridia bacterium]